MPRNFLVRENKNIQRETFETRFFFLCRAFVRILCACCPGRVRRRYQPAFRCKPSQVSMKYSYFAKSRHVHDSRPVNKYSPVTTTDQSLVHRSLFHFENSPSWTTMPCLSKGSYHKISSIRSSSNDAPGLFSSYSYSNSTMEPLSPRGVEKLDYIGVQQPIRSLLRNREEQGFENSIS